MNNEMWREIAARLGYSIQTVPAAKGHKILGLFNPDSDLIRDIRGYESETLFPDVLWEMARREKKIPDWTGDAKAALKLVEDVLAGASDLIDGHFMIAGDYVIYFSPMTGGKGEAELWRLGDIIDDAVELSKLALFFLRAIDREKAEMSEDPTETSA